jgi:hypothetical protein
MQICKNFKTDFSQYHSIFSYIILWCIQLLPGRDRKTKKKDNGCCYATIMRWAVISNPFLGNSLGNTFLRKWLRMKQSVVYVVLAEELKRRELGQPVS